MDGDSGNTLTGKTVSDFVYETSSESPAPGGGSVSALCGSLGTALGTMVANLSAHKRGWDDRWAYFSEIAEKGMSIQKQLLFLVEEDTRAFNVIMDAFKLPADTAEQKAQRKAAIQEATRYAAEVPLSVMKTAYEGFAVLEAMAREGMDSSISDVGVGVLCIRTCIHGAWLNVKINAKSLTDESVKDTLLQQGTDLISMTETKAGELLSVVETKIG
jgi:glutamate formiminotransferase/formiminotetrahydrofolate cyclodeaminase